MTSLTAVAAVSAMRNGEIKAEEYARALLDRAQSLVGLNAFRFLDRESVLEAARAADKSRDAGDPMGFLHGLPIPVKDSVNTIAAPTSNGTWALRNFRPQADADVLPPLFGQGAILMGKTNIHELSYGWTSNNAIFGPVKNPYEEARIAGGSSGGSAAAVAARMAPLAIGEDTLGSIRVPAAMCGLAGFRPSYGRYPNSGVMPLTLNKFDQVGPLARSVEDLVLFDAVMTGDVPPDASSLRGLRIGIAPESFLGELDPEIARVTAEALRRLADAGVTLVKAEVPESVKSAMGVAMVIIAYETMPAITAFLAAQGARVDFSRLLQQASDGMRDVFQAFALPPKRPAREAYESMLAQRQRIRQDIRRHFERQGIAALAFPPIPIPPPLIGEEAEVDLLGEKVPLFKTMARNTGLATCAGMAGLVLPAGMASNGLPVGLEFDSLDGSDRALLALGLSLEKALGPIPPPKLKRGLNDVSAGILF